MSLSNCCIVLALAHVIGLNAYGSGRDCYSTDPSPYRRYSTKTAYDHVRASSVQQEAIPGCKAVSLHMVARHGSRYPGPGDRQIAYDVLQVLQQEIINNWRHGYLCEMDIHALANWTRRIVPKDQRRLSDTGRLEAFETALRFQQRYPGLLRRPYQRNLFRFMHTDTGRNSESAVMFAFALFNTSEGIFFDVDTNNDPILPYFDNCEKYEKITRVRISEEYKKFKYGNELNWTVADIRARLGLLCNVSLIDIDVVYSMYEICRFEYSVYRESPWCAVFQLENLKHLEYNEDMKYAGIIIPELACPLVADLLKTFDDARLGLGGGGVFRFGHTPNINAYLARLGLIADSDLLKADNYKKMSYRKWRTSTFCPMNANVAFVLYSCDDGQYRVKGFVNEHAVKIPGCEHTVCLYETVRSFWDQKGKMCNLDEICN